MYIQYSYSRLYNDAQRDYTNKSKNHIYLHHMVTHRKLAMLRGYQKTQGTNGTCGAAAPRLDYCRPQYIKLTWGTWDNTCKNTNVAKQRILRPWQFLRK
jgi:hypothetical protein